MRKTLRMVAILGLIGGMFWQTVVGIDYPTKPITIIVPWGAGGMSNVSTRMLGEKMKTILGQPIVYINKPGAGGVIGLNTVKTAKPDGYTIASGGLSLGFTAPFFLDAEGFNVDDFDYIGSYMPQERVLYTTLNKPYKTWEEFLEYSRQNPGKVSVGSGGAQWALEVMQSIAKRENIKWKYVMFKSGGEAAAAILGDHVDVCETGTGTPAYQAARQGQLISLVDLGVEKVPFFPDVKNMRDLGYPYATLVEYGMVLPKGVPKEIRAKLENALRTAMQDQKLMETMGQTGFTPRFLSGSEFRLVIKEVLEKTPALQEYVKDMQ